MARDTTIRCFSTVALLLTLLFLPLGGTAGRAQQAATTEGPEELWIEVVDSDGELLTASGGSLEITVDGQPVPVAEQDTAGLNWRVVLYFDQMLTEPLAFNNATIQLAQRARELTRLGEVEVILSGEEVRTSLPATRNPDALDQALAWIRLREGSEDLQAGIRESLVSDLALESSPETPGAPWLLPGSRAGDPAVEEALGVALAEERLLVQGQMERFLAWLMDNDSPGPKIIIFAGNGFDSDPEDFYRGLFESSGLDLPESDLGISRVTTSMEDLAQVLSVYGWLTVPFVPSLDMDALLAQAEADAEAEEQQGKDEVQIVSQDGRTVDKTTVGFDPLKLFKRIREREEEQPPAVLQEPLAPYLLMANATGGEVLGGTLNLDPFLARLPHRRGVVISPPPAITALPRRVVAKWLDPGSKPTGSVLVQRWISTFTPEAVSAMRVRRMLEGEMDEGDLAIAAAVGGVEGSDRGELMLQLDAGEIGEAGSAAVPIRITVARTDEVGATEIFHRTVGIAPEAGDQVRVERLDEDDTVVVTVALPDVPEDAVIVAVEDLRSSLWGGTFASAVESVSMTSIGDSDMGSLVLPAPKAVHLLAPREVLAMGQVRFETVVSERDIAQVDFFLDGEREAVRRTPPFSAVLDLGPLPRPRRVEVVALDAAGGEMGRDYIIVNEGSGVFGVRIVAPEPNTLTGESPKISGPVDVEAEVEPRRGEGIDRVEFYWLDELMATRYAPPFRQRIVIPDGNPKGFIRVVAFLDDGASSEDVVFVNSPASAQLRVNLMEFYVVVTDRQGRPVQDLTKASFRITEEGEEQEIASFSEAGDLPLTVGMAIDSSASMFVKLPEVQFAAAEFLRGLSTRRDRAFVVGFGNEPDLTRQTTSDLPDVIGSLSKLEPDGRTAIWKAIVYSLVQLQGVPGKKALVVYSDGADEDPDFSYRTALKFARKVGVPIYVILSNNEIVRTEGKGLSVRSFLKRLEGLVDSVGGRVYFARVGEDLHDVYTQIDEELRSQYVVGYYSHDAGGREWRDVKVDVAGSGLKARTIAGYFR